MTECKEAQQCSNIYFDWKCYTHNNNDYTGYIGETIKMISMLDRYVCLLSLNKIKDGVNKHLWSNISLTMYNIIKHSYLICQVIICSLINESYISLIQVG